MTHVRAILAFKPTILVAFFLSTFLSQAEEVTVELKATADNPSPLYARLHKLIFESNYIETTELREQSEIAQSSSYGSNHKSYEKLVWSVDNEKITLTGRDRSMEKNFDGSSNVVSNEHTILTLHKIGGSEVLKLNVQFTSFNTYKPAAPGDDFIYVEGLGGPLRALFLALSLDPVFIKEASKEKLNEQILSMLTKTDVLESTISFKDNFVRGGLNYAATLHLYNTGTFRVGLILDRRNQVPSQTSQN